MPHSAHVAAPDEANATASPLTIAHVTGYYMPGYGYQENHLPFAQAALGHDVHIVTSDRHVPDARFAGAASDDSEIFRQGECRERGVTIHRLSVPFEIRQRQNPWLRGLLRSLDAIGPDVVHLHGVTPLASLIVLLAPARPGRILVVDHHLCRFNLNPWTPAKRAWYGLWRHLLLPPLRNRVAAFMPINEDARAVLAAKLGIAGARVRINRLGADLSQFRWDSALRDLWRRRLGIDAASRVLVHAGRLGPRKEIESLLQAFASVGSANDMLIVAGRGDDAYERRLRTLASGAAGGVRFLPMQPAGDLAGLFNAADLAVWPGDGSVTLIQALGCGLPALIADDPGADYVAGCADAVVVPRGKPEVLARSIAAADGHSPERRVRIASFARQHFDWSSIAAESIATYREAGAGGASRAAK